MKLFTNTNLLKDIFEIELLKWGKDREIKIASAFFDNSKIVNTFLENNCIIKLIVRLDHGTNIERLKEIIKKKNVFIRYFTGRRFHPKFYIFKNGIAFIGSSNLTQAGLYRNNEANVSIDLDNPIYDELEQLFELYWSHGKALDSNILDKYESSYSSFQKEIDSIKHKIDESILNEFGNNEFSDTSFDKIDKNKKVDFIDNFKRTYQIFLSNFNTLADAYKEIGIRKDSTNSIPIHIEIDQLFNWIRNNKTVGNSYEKEPILDGANLKEKILNTAKEYIQDTSMNYFYKVVNDSYPTLYNSFKNEESIKNIDYDSLSNALLMIHSFYEQLRFHQGGYKTLISEFINKNTLEKIKKTFIFLLHSNKIEYQERIALCLYDSNYKLISFDDSCVKELYGWLNPDGIPIYNKRTYMSMRWLGFGTW